MGFSGLKSSIKSAVGGMALKTAINSIDTKSALSGLKSFKESGFDPNKIQVALDDIKGSVKIPEVPTSIPKLDQIKNLDTSKIMGKLKEDPMSKINLDSITKEMDLGKFEKELDVDSIIDSLDMPDMSGANIDMNQIKSSIPKTKYNINTNIETIKIPTIDDLF